MDVSEFHASTGVGDWRVLGNGLHARYRTDALAGGAALAADIAAASERGDIASDPQVDLRRSSVTVRLPSHESMFLDADDLAAAQWIQARAGELGLEPEPASLRQVQLAIAHAPGVEVRDFWQAVLGYVPVGDEDARDPEERNPRMWFHEIRDGHAGRGRSHLDVYVPADQAEAIIEAAVAAGGRIADSSNPPHWWTLASPDNHGVDIAPWPDRG